MNIGYIDPVLVDQTVDIAMNYGLISARPAVMYDQSVWEAAMR
jgi:hypothetical protein